ncbi:unnamed protein product, partial [Amoebophrya sp. A25]|eukprot:GSA25T00022319001.1
MYFRSSCSCPRVLPYGYEMSKVVVWCWDLKSSDDVTKFQLCCESD